jgi:hypothetical protein
MAEGVKTEIRSVVAARANYLCEYCLVAEEDTFFGCHVDHIISIKHGGESNVDNLAYACAFCNRFKGSDIASLLSNSGTLVRFFNPRIDRWSDHFQLQGLSIQPRTQIAEVTIRIRILRFNDSERILERQTLSKIRRYPNTDALARVEG